MMLNRRSLLTASAAALVAPSATRAQPAYPSGMPIRVIIPFAPAGSIDILARIIIDGLGKQIGQSIVAENRAGAGGNIAMGVAARAKPDGYTLLFASSVIVVNPLLYKSVPFDPDRDFVPIALLATSPNLFMAKPDFARTLPEFIDKAKAKPGALNYASPGVGTKAHFAAELLKLHAGIDVTHVPYASGSEIAQSLLTNSTQLGATALPGGEPFVHSGTFAGLAVTSARRWPTLPDVPTMVELGYPDFVAELFTALYAPAGTPHEVVQFLVSEVAKLARDPNVVKKAEIAGYAWVGEGPDAVRAKMAQEIAQTREVIKFSGIKVE